MRSLATLTAAWMIISPGSGPMEPPLTPWRPGPPHWLGNPRRLVDELAGLRHPEGWFQEYEGCDLGYQTVTLEFLARCQAKAPSERLWGLLKDNLEFLRPFLHPDGSLGGEYGSRNTYNFYPGGFALLSTRLPQAAEMLGGFFQGLESGARHYLLGA